MLSSQTSIRIEDWLRVKIEEYAKRNSLTFGKALHEYIKELEFKKPQQTQLVPTRTANGKVVYDSGDHGAPVWIGEQ